MEIFKKARISKRQKPQDLAKVVTAFIHDNMKDIQHFLLPRTKDTGQIMNEELEVFLKGQLKKTLGRKVDSLSPADAADLINTLLYVINHYKSPRGAFLNHRLKQVRDSIGRKRMVFEAGEKPWPDIHSLLVRDLPQDFNRMMENSTLTSYSAKKSPEFTLISHFKQKYGGLVTPEHDRTLFMAIELSRVADQEERDLVMSILEDIHEYSNRVEGHHYGDPFFTQFELSFMFLRDLLETVTCNDFIDSMLRSIRN